jgi:putative transcriptional regulator
MDEKLFSELVESVTEMGEIIRGERAPSREFTLGGPDVKKIRRATGLSQAKFAMIVRVPLGTLQNWEQGRRAPTGPAQVLLRAIENNPKAVLKAIAG